MFQYIISDITTGAKLLERSGFQTKEDAAEQARMDANCINLKNFSIDVVER